MRCPECGQKDCCGASLGPELDALRKHAERLACVLEDARFYFSENDIYDYDRVMEISIDDYRAAYPKEAEG